MIKKVILIISLALVLSINSVWAISPLLHNKAALQLAEEWQNKRIKPILSLDGKIVYVYGATAVTVLTKLYHSTDIELQAGETLQSISTGDTVRWVIEAAYHGKGKSKTLHIFVKPHDAGLTTNLTVLTSKRAYRFNLKSSKTEHMGIVGFEYPKHYQDIVRNLKAQDAIEKAKKEKITIPSPLKKDKRLSIADLDFNYGIDGDEPVWKPVRVYNDGVKTIIELAEKAKYTRVPVLSIIDEGNEKAIVNYRLLNNKFVVDMLFEKAILVSGVGRDQVKVIIEHKVK